MHKATASRLVATLAERGLVERDPITEKYRLGFGLIRLAGAAMAGLDLVRSARPILEDLADRTRETVNLGVLSGDAVVYIDQVTGTRSIVGVSWVGPAHAAALHVERQGAAGVHRRARARAAARRPARRLTPRTIADPARLRAQLEEIRARGYAQTMEELEEGLNAVAAPVRGRRRGRRRAQRLRAGVPDAAVDLPRVGRLAVEAAAAVSRRLGYVERGRRAAG